MIPPRLAGPRLPSPHTDPIAAATMQSMQRQFGKLLNKGAGDSSKVSVILNDYEDADKVLARVSIAPP